MSNGSRVCYLCGKPCYGRTCIACFKKDKYKRLSKKGARRKHYVKYEQVQRQISGD